MKQLFFKTLLFLYLTSSYLSATHIHNSEESHHTVKCQVCTVVKTFQSADLTQANEIPITIVPLYEISSHFSNYIPKNIYKGYFSTAPPLS